MTPITVRFMQPEERRAVINLAWRVFPFIQFFFFTLSPHILVAVASPQGAQPKARLEPLIGAAVLKLFSLPHGRKGGLVSWLFTAPEARGRGAGQELVEAALAFFEQQGCDEVFACVEGNNSSSFKQFASRGFGILSLGEQVRRYGLGAFKLWHDTYHVVDQGHFLWARPAPSSPDRPALQWLGAVLINALALVVAASRLMGRVDPAFAIAAVMALAALYGLRALAMHVAAKRVALPVRFRLWESASPVTLGISLLGGIYPSPGNVYPSQRVWRFRDLLPQLGPIALAGAAALVLGAWGTWAVARLAILPDDLARMARLIRGAAVWAACFDVLLPFFPFEGYNGYRIWRWKRAAWVVLAVLTAPLLFA